MNQGSWWCKAWSLKVQELGTPISEGRKRWTSQLKKREKENWPFLHLFLPFGPSVDWMMTVHIGEGESLHSVCWIKCWSPPETPWGTHSEIIFHHLFRDPLVQSTWHIQLNITMYIFYISCWIHFVAFYTYMHIYMYINIYIFTREVDLSFYFLVLFWFW